MVSVVTAPVSLMPSSVRRGRLLLTGDSKADVKGHDFSKDVLCAQQCSVPVQGTPSALLVNEGMLTLVKQMYSCTLESGLKKNPYPA